MPSNSKSDSAPSSAARYRLARRWLARRNSATASTPPCTPASRKLAARPLTGPGLEVEAHRERERRLRLRLIDRVAHGRGRARHALLVGAGAIVDRGALERERRLEGQLEDVVLELGADEEPVADDVRLVL